MYSSSGSNLYYITWHLCSMTCITRYTEILSSAYCKDKKIKKRKNTGYLGYLKSNESSFSSSMAHPPPVTYRNPVIVIIETPTTNSSQTETAHPLKKTRVRAPRCSLPIIQCDATDYGLRWVRLVMGLKLYPTNPLTSKHILTTLACVHVLG